MNKIKISIIIPVYNVEEYISECLDSIINQSLREIEIICINDGSTDNSLKIIKDYEKMDSRIKVINQSNKGLGATRNVGIENSNGEYIYFMDSDDYLELCALEELYDLAKTKLLDIILFKLINFHDETQEKFTTEYYEMDFLKKRVGNNIFNYKDIKDLILRVAVSAPGKLFKKTLISDMKFPENIIFEDNPFFIEAILNADKVYFYDKHLYNRRIRDNSITTSQFSNFSDAIPISNLIFNIFKKLGLFNEFASDLFYKKINQIFYRYNLIREEDKEDFFNKMKQDFLINKEYYETFDSFINIHPRLKNIFYSCIKSDSYKEFDLHILLYETNENMIDNINKLKISNNQLIIQIELYENEIKELKNQKNKLSLEVLKLKNLNEYYQMKFCQIFNENNMDNEKTSNVVDKLRKLKK